MDAIERSGAAPEALILEAALECLGGDLELKDLKQADIERMADAVAGALPERWPEIRALMPRLKKKAQNAIVQAMLKRKPPLREPEIFIACASVCHELDANYRAGLIARLARLGDTAEAGRQLITLLQEYADGPMRPGPLGRLSINDCATLHNLLIERVAELMLFHKAMLRIALDWNIRLNAEPAERRRLIGTMAKLLAKLKWRDIADELLEPWLNAFVSLIDAGSITLSPEWPMLFKMILKQLRHRPTDSGVLLALGKLIRSGAADAAPATKATGAQPAPRTQAPAQTPRMVYDPQGGALSSSSIYPPHVGRQALKPFQHAMAPASFVGEDDETLDDNAESEPADTKTVVIAANEEAIPAIAAEAPAEEEAAPATEEEDDETLASGAEDEPEDERGGAPDVATEETPEDEMLEEDEPEENAAAEQAAAKREAIARRLDQLESMVEGALAEIRQLKARMRALKE